MQPDMQQLLIVSTLQTLIMAVFAVLLVWLLLRLLDRISGYKFTLFLEEIRHEPMALSVYFGLRFVGACLLVGLAI